MARNVTHVIATDSVAHSGRGSWVGSVNGLVISSSFQFQKFVTARKYGIPVVPPGHFDGIIAEGSVLRTEEEDDEPNVQ